MTGKDKSAELPDEINHKDENILGSYCICSNYFLVQQGIFESNFGYAQVPLHLHLLSLWYFSVDV